MHLSTLFVVSEQTLISEFNLVCDRENLTNISEMMFLVGIAFGGLVCGIISDKFGRKRTLMLSVLLQTVLGKIIFVNFWLNIKEFLLGVIIAFAPSIELYYILRTFLGFISVSVVFSGFVLSIEIVGGIWRTVAGVCYLVPLAISYIAIAGIAYLLRDWRQLQLAISLSGIPFIALW